MGRLSKRELKEQEYIFDELLKKDTLTENERWYIYENINIGYINSVSQTNAFFTPLMFGMDVSLMTYREGNVVDICSGIGLLSYAMSMRDQDDKRIKSYTCIELVPQFVEIGKKLFPQANWICASAFDKSVWDEITKDLPDNKFDVCISNPPFGKLNKKFKEECSWMNYSEEMELMVMELALKYSRSASLILPACSVEFKTEPYYERINSNKVEKFRKKNPDLWFFQEYNSVDAKTYIDDWKNLKGIKVEAVDLKMDKSEYQ